MTRDRAAYVTLALTPGIGRGRLALLLDACGSAEGALAAPSALLRALPGFSSAAVTTIKAADPAVGQALLDQAAALGAICLLPQDESFPRALREIPDPPALVFVQGNPALLHQEAVAVVGSRDHTHYGAEAARLVAGSAARQGLVVVSGMARGLDAVAHLATLDAGGGTIGVLGNGLGVIYPAANRRLYERVAECGLLLTEFPPGERPQAHSFPRRNRLISALARVTVVVEAAAGSGALITADCALEQGREVMAVPGPVTSRTSAGANRLLRDGAGPWLEPADLAGHYPGLAAPPPGRPVEERRPRADLPESLLKLYAQLGGEARHIDDLVRHAARPMAETLAALSQLELEGLAVQEPGWRFRRS